MPRGNPNPKHKHLRGTSSAVTGANLRSGEVTTSVGVRGDEPAIQAFKALSREERGRVVEAWYQNR